MGIHLLRCLSIPIGLILISLATSLSGQDANSTTIIQRSPFIPADWKAPPINSPAANVSLMSPTTLEFKGVYQIGKNYFFNIFDKTTKVSHWVAFNSSDEEYKITQFDPSKNSITIETSNSPISLTMVTPKFSSIPVDTTIRPASRSPSRRRVISPTSQRTTQTKPRRGVVRRP